MVIHYTRLYAVADFFVPVGNHIAIGIKPVILGEVMAFVLDIVDRVSKISQFGMAILLKLIDISELIGIGQITIPQLIYHYTAYPSRPAILVHAGDVAVGIVLQVVNRKIQSGSLVKTAACILGKVGGF